MFDPRRSPGTVAMKPGKDSESTGGRNDEADPEFESPRTSQPIAGQRVAGFPRQPMHGMPPAGPPANR